MQKKPRPFCYCFGVSYALRRPLPPLNAIFLMNSYCDHEATMQTLGANGSFWVDHLNMFRDGTNYPHCQHEPSRGRSPMTVATETTTSSVSPSDSWNSMSTVPSPTTSSEIGNEQYPRASKRIRLASPTPHYSSTTTMKLNTSSRRIMTPRQRSNATGRDFSDDRQPIIVATPPDIQRLALPSLIHCVYNNYSTQQQCPFGTLP
jgi:hypothetical protein